METGVAGEQGFEFAVGKNATAAAKIPVEEGFLAALTNSRFVANAVWTTNEGIARLKGET